MCGIVAAVNFDRSRPVSTATLRAMTHRLARRGPDDAGVWQRGAVGLGHRRLAIIDLSRNGRGPMHSSDGRLTLSYNGEIYNFRELRAELAGRGYRFRTQTDSEVVLHAYAEWGVDCLRRFNGMFAFALWDSRLQRLFAARDRFGVKPLVFWHDDERFACASELKSLRADPEIPLEIDPVAVHHYLSLMNVPAPFTIYKGVRKLPPGHYLLVQNGRVDQRRWWDLELGEQSAESESQMLQRLDYLLDDSVRLRMVSDAPLGAFLSGGVDSSLVAAYAARQHREDPLRTFSVSFAGVDGLDESDHSRRVAGHLGTNHSEIDLQADFLQLLPDAVELFDEPFAVSSALALYAMARETARQVKVVLTGDGGDEVFGGYFRHTVPDARFDRIADLPFSGLRRFNPFRPMAPIAWRTPNWLRRPYQLGVALTTADDTVRTWRVLQMLQVLNEREKMALYTPEWAEWLQASPDYCSTDEFLGQFLPVDAPNRLSRWLYFDLRTSLADEMLAKVDKATMAWGLEARNPFLDYRLVQYAMTLPGSVLARSNQSKRLLKRLAQRYVPKEVVYRPKQGFQVPLDGWFRSQMPPLLADVLAPSTLRRDGVFSSDTVRRVVCRHQCDQRIDLSHAILNVACLGLWQGTENTRLQPVQREQPLLSCTE